MAGGGFPVIRALVLSVAGVLGAAAAASPLVQGLVAIGVVALIAMLGAVVFSGSDRPTDHVVDIIEAVKGSARRSGRPPR
jgi:hypothetical protein